VRIVTGMTAVAAMAMSWRDGGLGPASGMRV
jgi:hypothetical protein